MGTQIESGVPGSERLATDRAWVRWVVAAAVTAMLAWVVGVALIPLNAKLDKGDQHLAQVLRAHTGQLYAAALLAILGAVLLAGFFAVLTRPVPEGYPGWGLLRVSLAGCVITQTMVAVGASFALAGVHAAAGNAAAGQVVLGWRGLWLTFLASAIPTILFTVTGVLGLRRPGCRRRGCPPWAGYQQRHTCWCCSPLPSEERSHRTESSPHSSRLPPPYGSSPWPPHCRGRGEKPPAPAPQPHRYTAQDRARQTP